MTISNAAARRLAGINSIVALAVMVIEFTEKGFVNVSWGIILLALVWFFFNAFIFWGLSGGQDEKK